MTDQELMSIHGGAVSGVIIRGILKAFSIALELGRSLGTALRRSKDKNLCK